jgi:hypothetical protein
LETNDPKCFGVEGLLQAYMIAQSRVELSGPTDFASQDRQRHRRRRFGSEESDPGIIFTEAVEFSLFDKSEYKFCGMHLVSHQKINLNNNESIYRDITYDNYS